MQPAHALLGLQRGRAMCRHGNTLPFELRNLLTVVVYHRDGIAHDGIFIRLVAHLALSMQGGCARRNIVVVAVDIRTGGAKVAEQGQGLVYLICDMQPNVLRQAAVVDVKRL